MYIIIQHGAQKCNDKSKAGDGGLDKAAKRNSIMKLAGFSLLTLAGVFLILLFVTSSPDIQLWFSRYDEILYRFECAVASIGYEYIIVVLVFLLYAIKCFAPIISVPAICVITGMVFPTFTALFVNASGVFFMLTVKYKMGVLFGGGNARKLLNKNEITKTLIEHDGEGNPWLLFIFRLVPGFPINNVSQLYGSLNFNFKKFSFISMLGFAPKILSYTFIGRNVYNPLSWHFFMPIIILLIISGGSLLGLNSLLNYFDKA